jgi:hypothetical protein
VDGARQRRLQLGQRCPARGGLVGGQADGHVLESGNGLDDLQGNVAVVLDAQACGAARQVQRPLGG